MLVRLTQPCFYVLELSSDTDVLNWFVLIIRTRARIVQSVKRRSGSRRVRCSKPAGARLSDPFETVPEAHAASCTMGIGSLSWGVKRSGRGARYQPPSTAGVEYGDSCTSASPLCLLAMSRESFTFSIRSIRWLGLKFPLLFLSLPLPLSLLFLSTRMFPCNVSELVLNIFQLDLRRLVLWDVKQLSPVKIQQDFEGAHCLHLQCWTVYPKIEAALSSETSAISTRRHSSPSKPQLFPYEFCFFPFLNSSAFISFPHVLFLGAWG